MGEMFLQFKIEFYVNRERIRIISQNNDYD